MHSCFPGNEPIHISDETVHLHRVKLSPVNSPSATHEENDLNAPIKIKLTIDAQTDRVIIVC